MKRGVFALIAFLSVSSTSIAQVLVQESNIEITPSVPHKNVNYFGRKYEQNDQYMVSIKTEDGESFLIQSFDKATMSEVGRSKFKRDYNSTRIFEGFEMIGENFWLFFLTADESEDQNVLSGYQVNPATAQVDLNSSKVICTVNSDLLSRSISNPWITSTGKIPGFGQQIFSFSSTENTLMINYSLEKSVGEFEWLRSMVYNGNLNELGRFDNFKKEIGFDFGVNAYFMDTDGIAYYLVHAKDEELGTYDSPEYYIVRVSSQYKNKKLIPLPIVFDGWFSQVKLMSNTENEIAIAGLVQVFRDPQERMVSMRLNKQTGSIVSQNTHKIESYLNDYGPSDKLIDVDGNVKRSTGYESDDVKRQKQWKPRVRLNDVVIAGDGGLIIMMEEHVRSKFYSDGLVAKLDSDFKLEWVVNIPKLQQVNWLFGYHGDISYTYLFDDEELYIIYLDNYDNLELEKGALPKIHQDNLGGFMTSSTINLESGEVSKNHILNFNNFNGRSLHYFNTDWVVHTDSDELYFEIYRKKKEDVWIRIDIK